MYIERKIDEYVFQFLKYVIIVFGGVLLWIYYEFFYRKRGGIQLKFFIVVQDGFSVFKVKKLKVKVILVVVFLFFLFKGGKVFVKGKVLKFLKVKFNVMKIFDVYFFM